MKQAHLSSESLPKWVSFLEDYWLLNPSICVFLSACRPPVSCRNNVRGDVKPGSISVFVRAIFTYIVHIPSATLPLGHCASVSVCRDICVFCVRERNVLQGRKYWVMAFAHVFTTTPSHSHILQTVSVCSASKTKRWQLRLCQILCLLDLFVHIFFY